MPARIYALAKELKVDSKDLVDLVKKVGITGKGSALASLTDEEAQKVRDHISGAGKPEPVAAPVATTAPTAVRDVVPERKHVAIKVARSSTRGAAVETPEKPVKRATPAPKSPVAVEPVVEVPVTPEKKEEAVQEEAPAPQTPKPSSLGSRIKSRMGVRRGGAAGNDPVAPVRRDATVAGGKMRSLDRPAASGEKKADSAKPKRKSAAGCPGVKTAPTPCPPSHAAARVPVSGRARIITTIP